MNGASENFASYRELFEKDRVAFTELLENTLLKVKKKEDLEPVLEIFAEMRKEVVEVSPFLSSAIHPVLVMMIKNHYYKQIAENAELFEACANVAVCRQLDDLVSKKKSIRFLTPVENYRIKKLSLGLAEKFKQIDIVRRLEVELRKADLEWRDSVE